MKLRLRLNQTTSLVEVDQDCTLGQLKDIVTEKLQLTKFHVSLNGKDALEEDEKKLVDQDIVSGDLIRILTAEQPVMQQNHAKNAAAAAASNHVEPNYQGQSKSSDPVAQDSNYQMQVDKESSPGTSAEHDLDLVTEDEDCIKDSTVNRYLNEPALIRDSTTSQVPQTLSVAWQFVTQLTEHHAIIPALHVLMTEVGFVQKDKPEHHPVCAPCLDVTSATAAFKLLYTQNFCNHSFTLMFVPIGPMMVIHGLVNCEKEEVICQLQIKPKDFISDVQNKEITQVFKDLPKLSRLFKDAIAYPLLQRAKVDLGEVPENSFLGLLTELKVTIMSLLDVKSLLALTLSCQEMHSLSQERSLWRRLYLKDFGRLKSGENDLSQDWQKLYREKYVQRARYRQSMRYATLVTPSFIHRPTPPAPFPFGPVYPPGGIGGDYDREPNFGGYPGAIGPFPRAMFPPRPRFDPFGPAPGHNFRPGRGGGMWEDQLPPGGLNNGPLHPGGLGSRRGGFGFGPRLF